MAAASGGPAVGSPGGASPDAARGALALRVEGGRRAGEVLRLGPGEARIGTAASCELSLREKGVAFRHALLRIGADGAATVEDLSGKSGGTFVDGARVAPGDHKPLPVGSRVRLGECVVELSVVDPTSAPAVAPAAAPAAPPVAPVPTASPPASASAPVPAPAAPPPVSAPEPEPPPPKLVGPPVLELRLEGGKRSGELLSLPAGELKLGTAASNDVPLRERGIAFRHALLRVSHDGRATIEDLTGKGGTRVQGEVLAPGRRWLLGPGDRVALGDLLELVVLERPPADAQAAFEELVPAALCPPRARALVELLAGARSLAEARAAREGPGQRPDALELFDADVTDWVLDAQRLLRPGLLAADPAAWVRHHEGEDVPLAVHLGADGSRLLLRRWDLVARIPPQPAPGAGDAARAAQVLPWLLAGAERLLPTKLEPLGEGGWHRVDYVALRADYPLLGRFERIEAVTDGRVVAADLVPTVAAASVFPLVAEDALEDSIRERQTKRFYRPASRGPAGNVPPVPMGGRYGRLRHKPRRGE